MSWKSDLNKMENGTLGAILVPINKVTKFEAHFYWANTTEKLV